MNVEHKDEPDSPTPVERQLAAWLDSYDSSLKGDSDSLAVPRPDDLSPEARLRLRRAQTCLFLLNQARPDSSSSSLIEEQALLEVVLDEMRLRQSLGDAPQLSE